MPDRKDDFTVFIYDPRYGGKDSGRFKPHVNTRATTAGDIASRSKDPGHVARRVVEDLDTDTAEALTDDGKITLLVGYWHHATGGKRYAIALIEVSVEQKTTHRITKVSDVGCS